MTKSVSPALPPRAPTSPSSPSSSTRPAPAPPRTGSATRPGAARPWHRRLVDEAHLRFSIHAQNVLLAVAGRFGDPFGRLETEDDLVGLAADLRSEPVVISKQSPWVTARYDVCRTLLRSPHVTSGPPDPRSWWDRLLMGPAPETGLASPIFDTFITLDGPAHARMRRLAQPAFTPAKIRGWRAATERVAEDLLDAFPASGPVDFVEAYAAPLPITVICELLGVPVKDRERFRRWADALATALDRARSVAQAHRMHEALAEATVYLNALVAERRRAPADDLLSTLVTAEVDGDRLDDHSVVSTGLLLLFAGFETTVNLLGRGTRTLLAHPDQLAWVAADPEARVPGLVEEALRYDGPVSFTFRTTTTDLEVPGGVTLPADTDVILLLAGANRDPAVFPDPDRFDVTRANAREHLAFGSGPHMCLGASLARMEAEVAWTALLRRYPDVGSWRAAGPAVPNDGKVVRGLRSLPVVLGRPVRPEAARPPATAPTGAVDPTQSAETADADRAAEAAGPTETAAPCPFSGGDGVAADADKA